MISENLNSIGTVSQYIVTENSTQKRVQKSITQVRVRGLNKTVVMVSELGLAGKQ